MSQHKLPEGHETPFIIHFVTWLLGIMLASGVFFWGAVLMTGAFSASRPKAATEDVPAAANDVKSVTTPDPVTAMATSTSEAKLPLFEEGRAIFATICGVCHQPTGLGLSGMFPPLAASDWVTAQSPNRLIRIVLHGFQGPITINGQPFSTPAPVMPAQGALPDDKVAAVLTYIRNSWGNQAPAVTVEQVKAVREAEKTRTAMWDEASLLKIAVTENAP